MSYDPKTTALLDELVAREESQFGAGVSPGAQGSIEWLMERVGHCTASRFKDVMDYQKSGKPGAKRTAYLWELVCERLTGKPAEHYESAAMQHGSANEPLARMAYEARTGAIVMQTGFRKHKTIAWLGGSPDGLVEPDGGIEAKCPFNSANHLACWLSGMPADHIPQVQGLIWLNDAAYWDFVSYDPRMPHGLDLYVQRIPRNEEYIRSLAVEIDKFLAEVQEQVTALHRIAAMNEIGASA